MLTNIVDGWLYNARIKYLPFRYLPMALGQLDAVRRAVNLRNRYFVLPENIRNQIPARGQYNRQIRLAPGSILIGATLWQSQDLSFGFDAGTADLSLQVTDQATGTQLFSEFISGEAFAPLDDGGRGSLPCLLTQPRMFLEAGEQAEGSALLSVEIANHSDLDLFVQFCMWFVEPCELREAPSCP